MSCETRPREGLHRAAFLLVRLVVLAVAFADLPLAGPLLALFYLAVRRMPYDLI